MIEAVTKNNNVDVRMCEHEGHSGISRETFLDELYEIMYQGIKQNIATDIDQLYMLSLASKLSKKGSRNK